MENENYNRNIWYNILCKTEGDYLIIKHVYNGNITCAHYENEKTFIKQCRKPEFRDVLLNAKDVIVLENNGKQLAKVVAWYDNEMGYSAQMVRTAKYLGGK